MATYEVKKATLQETKTGKLVFHLTLDKYDRIALILEKGKQPKDLFDIHIH